ncbi:hypothetical protein BV25DRAFT_1953211 [Artomyces pyxidatus]|uniref:Uncharacterized protein n=1 Tax=Artomyces pyxidatus TaxID=48021 RepID=A0ACB8THF0_9AGAM|nr:hypothetical protein BV25DRAFT_1953211 [Artomyces pyxidatus]
MDEDACELLQKEEWEVLQSIYPDYCVSTGSSNGVIKLEIPVELGEQRTVTLLADDTASGPTSSVPLSLSLSLLPPVLLELILPTTYPLLKAPFISSLHATNSWLPRHSFLRRKLLEMWQPGETVLYNWVEWIRSAEFLTELYLCLYLLVSSVICSISHPAPHLLASVLAAYETESKTLQFGQMSYPCSVCLTSHKGSRCLQLLCGHIFCRACVEDGWKLYIAEGDVARVGCLDPECVKDGREACEDEVRRVATEDEVQRWKWLREKRIFDKDPSIIHCPVSLCQRPVHKPMLPDDAQEESGWDRLRTCDSCGYSFCSFCKRTWHGPLTDCPIPLAEKFVLEYMELPDDAPERSTLEMRYGKKNILRLLKNYKEDQANQVWLKKSTMSCPGCRVHVEKTMGCNHMTCARCRQHFCYRCGSKLLAGDPHKHFTTPGHPCYSKLFDYDSLELNDEWQPIEGFEED